MAEGCGGEPPADGIPEILRGTDPLETLDRLIESDPFQIESRACTRLRNLGLFLDPERLGLRAVARVAYAALAYRGEPVLDAWLDACIDLAVDDLLREQLEEEEERVPLAKSADKEFYSKLARIAGVPGQHGRRVCVVMNAMAVEDRRTFFAIVVEGKSVHRWVAEGYGPPAKVQESLRRIGSLVLGELRKAQEREDGGSNDR
jgi:hypothetical protein